LIPEDLLCRKSPEWSAGKIDFPEEFGKIPEELG